MQLKMQSQDAWVRQGVYGCLRCLSMSAAGSYLVWCCLARGVAMGFESAWKKAELGPIRILIGRSCSWRCLWTQEKVILVFVMWKDGDEVPAMPRTPLKRTSQTSSRRQPREHRICMLPCEYSEPSWWQVGGPHTRRGEASSLVSGVHVTYVCSAESPGLLHMGPHVCFCSL